MGKVTSESFLVSWKKSLVENAAFEDLRKKLHEQYGDKLPEDPVELGKHFEDAKLLTRWHIEKICKARYKGSFSASTNSLAHFGYGRDEYRLLGRACDDASQAGH